MKKESTSITVSIDLDDEFEVSLLNHVKSKGNKSKYLKRLIYDDMNGIKQVAPMITEEKPSDDEIGGFF